MTDHEWPPGYEAPKDDDEDLRSFERWALDAKHRFRAAQIRLEHREAWAVQHTSNGTELPDTFLEIPMEDVEHARRRLAMAEARLKEARGE